MGRRKAEINDIGCRTLVINRRNERAAICRKNANHIVPPTNSAAQNGAKVIFAKPDVINGKTKQNKNACKNQQATKKSLTLTRFREGLQVGRHVLQQRLPFLLLLFLFQLLFFQRDGFAVLALW